MRQNWVLHDPVPSGVVSSLGLPRLHAQLLYNRGITTREAALGFLNPSESDVHDPFLLPDMSIAVSRIRRALSDGETIGVFGDFDIDGISGTAIVSKGLRHLGGHVVPYIPDRHDEGHGLNEMAVRSLADRGVSVLVTVDCGATSDSESALALSLGIDTVVTDHHAMFGQHANAALAMVNPQRLDSVYPFEHLTGAGLAYKLVQAVYSDRERDMPGELIQFAALGTVGDVGKLVGENRYMVSEGLRRANLSPAPAISALAEVSGLRPGEIDATDLSFQIIPRMNAPGRLADAGISLELLMADDSTHAKDLASVLDQFNVQRRTLTEDGFAQAQTQIRQRWGETVPGIIMVGRRDWNPGILGLIAARIGEAYGRPTIAVAVGEAESRASARSVSGYNILRAIEQRGDLLVRFGGHSQAAGFTVPTDRLGELAAHFESVGDAAFDGRLSGRAIVADLAAEPSLVRDELFDCTLDLAPYGAGAPQPLFVAEGLSVIDSRPVGRGRHLKLRLEDSRSAWDAIAFRKGDRSAEITRGRAVDVAYRMEHNTWNGRTSIQLVVEDFDPR